MGIFSWLAKLFGFGKGDSKFEREVEEAFNNKSLAEDEKFEDEKEEVVKAKPAERAKTNAKRIKKGYVKATTDKKEIWTMVINTYFYSKANLTIDGVVEAINKNHKVEFKKVKDEDGVERWDHEFEKDGKTYTMRKNDFNDHDVWTNFTLQIAKTTKEDDDTIGYRKRFIIEIIDYKTGAVKKTIDSYKKNPRPGYDITKDEVLTPEQWEKRRENWYKTKGK